MISPGEVIDRTLAVVAGAPRPIAEEVYAQVDHESCGTASPFEADDALHTQTAEWRQNLRRMNGLRERIRNAGQFVMDLVDDLDDRKQRAMEESDEEFYQV